MSDSHTIKLGLLRELTLLLVNFFICESLAWLEICSVQKFIQLLLPFFFFQTRLCEAPTAAEEGAEQTTVPCCAVHSPRGMRLFLILDECWGVSRGVSPEEWLRWFTHPLGDVYRDMLRDLLFLWAVQKLKVGFSGLFVLLSRICPNYM